MAQQPHIIPQPPPHTSGSDILASGMVSGLKGGGWVPWVVDTYDLYLLPTPRIVRFFSGSREAKTGKVTTNLWWIPLSAWKRLLMADRLIFSKDSSAIERCGLLETRRSWVKKQLSQMWREMYRIVTIVS